ncbi:MAG: sulfatase-like hydrolase/transferase [Alphaproteobacteria bacterium]|nr:sulfatase-like hydrolase/transferase [Alphaproteobacteria bacterium]
MLTLLAALAGCSGSEPPRPPDILLVVLDTVRADHLAVYGHSRDNSRQLAALAQAGVLFEDVTAPGAWTWPSHASLFTGLPPWQHGAHQNPEVLITASETAWSKDKLDPELPTLAEQLAAAGYRTEAHATNDLLAPELGLTRGFAVAKTYDNDVETVAAARAALQVDDPRPLLLFVNLLNAHAPYTVAEKIPFAAQHQATLEAPPAWLAPMVRTESEGALSVDPDQHVGETGVRADMAWHAGQLDIPEEGLALLRDLYDSDLVGLDLGLKELLDAWIGSGRSREVVAVTSDHGEYFGEHRLLQHCCTTYTPVLGVPLVLAAPGRIPAGLRLSDPVQLQDLHPTLLELAGVVTERPARSLLRPIEGEPLAGPIQARAWRSVRWAQQAGGLYTDSYRYHREGERVVVVPDAGVPQLYDLSADPMMLQDIAPQHPEEAAAMAERARASIVDRESTGMLMALDDETIQKLREMGYID